MALSPAIAPVIGGFLSLTYTWRASFIFVFVFTTIVFVLLLIYLPRPNLNKKQRPSIHILFLIQSLIKMIKNYEYLKATLSLSIASLCWWYYVAGSPIMFHKLGLTPEIIGILYTPAVIPYLITAFVGRKMLTRKKPQQIYHMGNKLLFLSAFFMPILILTYHLNLFIVIIATMLVTMSNGFIVSMSMSAGMSEFKNQSGLAAGLLGTIQLLSGALASFIIGLAGKNFNLNYYAWFIFFSVVICSLIYYFIKPSTNLKGDEI